MRSPWLGLDRPPSVLWWVSGQQLQRISKPELQEEHTQTSTPQYTKVKSAESMLQKHVRSLLSDTQQLPVPYKRSEPSKVDEQLRLTIT